MEWIQTTASTVAEAETKALDLLGVDLEDAEIQVLEEGRTGLFGRVKSEARVRARIKPKPPAVKDERRSGRGDNRNRNRNRGKGGGNRNRDDRSGRNGSGSNKGQKRDGGGQRGKGDGQKRDDAKQPAAAASGGSGGGNRNRNRNRGKGGGGSARDQGRRDDRRSEDREEMPIDEQRQTLEDFVVGVATAFDESAKVELVEEDTTLSAQVTGEDVGRLIGNKAQTLQTLEELARTAMHRAAAGRRYHRIQVDVDNYRGRRREALARFAVQVAESVVDSGVSKAMEPMGAADRKLVHDAVSAVEGVETVSEGREPRRYIVITPLGGSATDEEE